MKLTRRFHTEREAWAFLSGLYEASDGNVHRGEVNHSPFTGEDGVRFDWEVTWHNENRREAEDRPSMTPQEYVKKGGNYCPVCRGQDIEADGRVTTLDANAFQSCRCNNPDCEASWTDCYELSGYDNLER